LRFSSASSLAYFFDCDTKEPANALVVAADVPLCRAADAFASIGLLVVLLVPACESALPAKLRCSADAVELPRVRPAEDATLPPVDFPAISNLQFFNVEPQPLLVDLFGL
jgi:hypothetical protein